MRREIGQRLSLPAKKDPAGASNVVFAGTSIISGTATILICRTGSRSALGQLATSLAEKPPSTDFVLGIRRFSMLIMRFTVVLIIFVLVVNVWFARPISWNWPRSPSPSRSA